ncbi:hypothetical protein D3C83_189440 [compost metagenome]
MIEIEFSALARLSLHRRIPTVDRLRTEILALVGERHHHRIKIHWQFSIQSARTKLNSRYAIVNSANSLFQEI